MRVFTLTAIVLMLVATSFGWGAKAIQEENQETENTQELVKFTFDLNRPVFRHGGFSDWDSRHVGPGAVVFDGEIFHMFRNGYRGWPQRSQVGYMTSEDGFVWVDSEESPVFLSVDIPFENIGPTLLTAALLEEDGTWVFYFAIFNTNASTTLGIARATADSPTGTWVMDEEFVLQPGPEGSWDERSVSINDVIKTEDGYRMYFVGDNQSRQTSIGLAYSEDGITWEKHNDPATTDAMYADSDPILERAPDSWEVNPQDPRVSVTPDGWVLFYSSFNGNFGNQGYGIATSDDGISWTRIQEEPVMARSEIVRNPWYPEFIYADGTYYFYLEADTFDGGTDIFLSTHEGSLLGN